MGSRGRPIKKCLRGNLAQLQQMARSGKIHSLAELARRLRRHRSTISRWVRRHDWPFGEAPPWDEAIVPRIKSWARETLQENRADPRYWEAADRAWISASAN